MKKHIAFVLISILVFTLSAVPAYAQARPRLAILPFTGGAAGEGDTIAQFFSFQPEIMQNFTVVPRTAAVEAVMREHRFQRSGLTDSDTIAELGRQMNADYVLAGHITALDGSSLLLVTIIHVEDMRQIAGVYREYRRIEEVTGFLPEMAGSIARAVRQNTAGRPRLAVLPFNVQGTGVNEADAEVLAQLLASGIANSGRYVVLPRTSSIERVMAEHNIQRAGMTDPDSRRRIGEALNARYVLSANVGNLGADNFFIASIINVETGEQTGGTFRRYRTVRDGLVIMSQLAHELAPPLVSMPMVHIAGGTFTMGSPANEIGRWDNEGPQRQVTVSGFNMGIHQVTREQWYDVMRTRPWGAEPVSNHPVTNVSWYDALVFSNRLSKMAGLSPAYEIRCASNNQWTTDTLRWGSESIAGDFRWDDVRIVQGSTGYRLPTEAQWEFAARAGTTTRFNTGHNINATQANFGSGCTMPVGSFPANSWGLYDMHGNVSEWVWDRHGAYPSVAQTDPIGASSGSFRVGRGGCWFGSAEDLRSAQRAGFNPLGRGDTSGFRLVRP